MIALSVRSAKLYGAGFAFQRAAAAHLAISDRCSGLMDSVRVLPPLRPPFRPRATAAGIIRRLRGAVPVAAATIRAASQLASGLRLLERSGAKL